MRFLVIGVLLLGQVATAHANDSKAVKAVVAAQAKAMASGGFSDTFAPDALVLLGPQAVEGKDALDAAIGDTGVLGGESTRIDKATPKKVVVGEVNLGEAWVTGEIAIKATTVSGPDAWTIRFSELVLADGDHWLVKVAQFAIPRPDKDAKTWAADPDRTAPDAVPGATDDTGWEGFSPADLFMNFKTPAGAAVLGSAPKELATGKAAKKLLGKWKKLAFTSVGGARLLGGEHWKAAIGNVELTAGKVTIPYRVLAIMVLDDGGDWELTSVHYAFTGY